MRAYLVMKRVTIVHSCAGLSWENTSEIDSIWASKKQAEEYCTSKNKGWARYWVAQKSYQLKGFPKKRKGE